MSGDFIFANPASQHSEGKQARKIINQTKTFLYDFFHTNEKEFNLFFHSGATEGLNTVIHHYASRSQKENRPLILAYAQGDHPAVVETCRTQNAIQFILKRDTNGDYLHEENLSELKQLKSQNPDALILYHHLWVHNELGVVSPLSEVKRFKEIPDLFMSVDAVQSPGKHYHYRELENTFDYYTFSAHKFGALKGIGFSFSKMGNNLSPFMLGGGQQNKLRSGTENVMGVYSIKLALEDLQKIDLGDLLHKKSIVEDKLRGWLKGKGGIVADKARHRSLNTIYFYLTNLTSDIAVAMFDLSGLEISAGSACSSGAAKESEILLSLGYKEVAKNGLRLSLGFQFSQEELDHLLKTSEVLFPKIP